MSVCMHALQGVIKLDFQALGNYVTYGDEWCGKVDQGHERDDPNGGAVVDCVLCEVEEMLIQIGGILLISQIECVRELNVKNCVSLR